MKVRDIIRLLEQDGWYLKTTKRSHRQYKHPTKTGTCDFAGPPQRRSTTRHAEQRPEAGRSETMNYVVIYEKSATDWSAYVPDLPGVITTGRTKEQVQRLIREAIEFHLEGLREDDLPIPEASASAEVVTVS